MQRSLSISTCEHHRVMVTLDIAHTHACVCTQSRPGVSAAFGRAKVRDTGFVTKFVIHVFTHLLESLTKMAEVLADTSSAETLPTGQKSF